MKERLQVFHLSQRHYLVYNTREIERLRTHYHVVGSLTGALPLYPTQVDFSGTPLLLSPEEVYVLHKEDVLQLVDLQAVLQQYTKLEIEEFKTKREEDNSQQVKQMIEHRQLKTQMFTQNKKQKVEERTDKDIIELKGQELIAIPTIPLKDINIDSFLLEWNETTWSKEDILKMRVFYDLWKKGFYLTNGSKFGGDFLAYPGDPLQFHAHYVVIVKSEEDKMLPFDLISYGRLGVTVKKTPVIAVIYSVSNTIKYISIDWQGVT